LTNEYARETFPRTTGEISVLEFPYAECTAPGEAPTRIRVANVYSSVRVYVRWAAGRQNGIYGPKSRRSEICRTAVIVLVQNQNEKTNPAKMVQTQCGCARETFPPECRGRRNANDRRDFEFFRYTKCTAPGAAPSRIRVATVVHSSAPMYGGGRGRGGETVCTDRNRRTENEKNRRPIEYTITTECLTCGPNNRGVSAGGRTCPFRGTGSGNSRGLMASRAR